MTYMRPHEVTIFQSYDLCSTTNNNSSQVEEKTLGFENSVYKLMSVCINSIKILVTAPVL